MNDARFMNLIMNNGLDAILNDKKKSFDDKVTTLLKTWENVASCTERSVETDKLQSLIEWAAEHTYQLVLKPDWKKHADDTNVSKTHLTVTLKRCAIQLSKQQHPAEKRCEALIEVVKDPWGGKILGDIINNRSDLDEIENEEDFCFKEKGKLLKMRLKTLCEDRCEDMALNLAAACVRSLRRNSRLHSVSEPSQINYMIDVYIVLLVKKGRTTDIVAQLKLMDLKDGLEMLLRLNGEKPAEYGTAKIWRKDSRSPRYKAATFVANYLITTGMVKPVADIGHDTLDQILNSWTLFHANEIVKTSKENKEESSGTQVVKISEEDVEMSESVVNQLADISKLAKKFIDLAESAQQIYIFCGVLIRHFKDTLKHLVIELYIKALTTDMNELEARRAKSNKEKVQETEQRLSREFLRIADYISDNPSIARECVLTAFSLYPTQSCYERIKKLAIACGKMKNPEVKEEFKDPVGAVVVEIKAETSSCSEQSMLKEEGKIDEIDQKSIERIIGVYTQQNNSTKGVELSPTKSDSAKTSQGQVEQWQSLNDPTSHNSSCPQQQDSVTIECNKTQQLEAPSIQRDNREALISTETDSTNSNRRDASNLDDLWGDLNVLLNTHRYQILKWDLEWKELSELCERYLENADTMRNSNPELKYLNIDYTQFENQPYDDDSPDTYAGIEKGYEQWDDSDFSESEHYQKLAMRNSKVRRSLDNSCSDTETEITMVRPKKGRPRKVPRLESSDTESERKFKKKHRQRFQKVPDCSDSSSDTNTQDSQTDSLGSDGFKKNSKKFAKRPLFRPKKVINRKPRKKQVIVDSASHFNMLVNENISPSGDNMSDPRRNDIMTLISMKDENNHETLTGTAAFNAVPYFISEKRTDPEVIKSLRMFRPQKLSQLNESTNVVSSVKKECVTPPAPMKKSNNVVVMEEVTTEKKFAPMLSTLNLLPKIPLQRVDEVKKKITAQQDRAIRQAQVTSADVKKELTNIKKNMSFSYSSKNTINGVSKLRSLKNPTRRKISSCVKSTDMTKSNLKSILSSSVPGMCSMEFSVLPQVQSTVQVVQLPRNIPQSPNSTASSNNTPPRGSGVRNTNIQLPGTPSSGGHDSGVGMSPAGQTPPPPTRTLGLQDVGEEANQPPDVSLGTVGDSNNTTVNSSDNTRTVALAVLNQRPGTNHTPKKSATSDQKQPQQQAQHQVLVRKSDGTYHLVQTNPNIPGQQRILSLQTLEDSNINFARQIPVAGSEVVKTVAQTQGNRNTGLPKFSTAFGKMPLTPESSSSAADAHDGPVAASSGSTVVQRVNSKSSVNMSKAVQTGVAPNLQAAVGTRQILNIMQSATNNSSNNAGVTTASNPAGGQTLLVPNSTTQSVIYAHKLPPTGNSPRATTQLISLPANLSNNRSPVQLKVNIIRPIVGSTAGTIISNVRIQQPQQQQSQQPASRAAETLEQLREFESVLEQVKERSTSSQSSSSDTTTVQTQTQGANTPPKVQQQQLIRTQGEFTGNGAAVAFQQQEVYPGQKVALMYSSQGASSAHSSSSSSTKLVSPVVVVTSYCQPGPASSPAPSVTSQSSSSPCVTPAPSTTPTMSSSSGGAKSSTTTPQKSSTSSAKKSAPTKTTAVKVTSAPSTPKSAPLPKPQQKPQEDPETTQRIYAILGQYAEQLRNSPDLNNKPAPRRRSNPPTNPNQSSKRKKSGSGKSKSSSGQHTSEPSPSPSADDMGRTMGSSEDSSGGGNVAGGSGIMHMDSPAGFSADEAVISSNNNSQSGMNDNANLGSGSEMKMSNTSDSNDSDVNIKRRNIVFAEPNTGQTRAVIVQEGGASSVSEALASVTSKMTTGTAVLVSGTNFMLPMNFVKAGQQITVVSGGSKLLAAVPAVRTTAGGTSTGIANTFVLQSLLSQANKVIHHQPTATTKQVKLGQPGQIVIPQGGLVRFASELENNGEPGIKTEANSNQRVYTSSAVKLAVKDNSQIVRLLGPIKTEPVVKDEKEEVVDVKPEIEEERVVQVKRKEEQSILADALTQGRPDSSHLLSKKIKQSMSPVPASTPTTTSSASFDAPSQQFFVTGGPGSSDSQESANSTSANIQASAMEINNMDGVVKVGNGVLCGNARLQEAWEPETKGSPDTPWRYTDIPSANTLDNLKVYSNDGETSETVNTSVLHIINKGQGIEMSSSGVFSSNKKYYNSSVDFQKFANKVLSKPSTTPASTNSNQETQQQKLSKQLLERELKLQKSLSEECEDLGVEQPSTSDLFPEAELLFDNNHSPAFVDNTSQEASCSAPVPKCLNTNTTTFFNSTVKNLGVSAPATVTESPTAVPSGKKKGPVQRRTPKPKETTQTRRNKRNSDGLANTTASKKLKMTQDEDTTAPSGGGNSVDTKEANPSQKVANKKKETTGVQQVKQEPQDSNPPSGNVVTTTPTKVDQRRIVAVNNSVSLPENDSNLTLLEENSENITLDMPMAPLTATLLTQRYVTYSNKKKPTAGKQKTNDFFSVDSGATRLSWESPVSERTRSSSEEREDLEHFSNTTFDGSAGIGNGLQEVVNAKSVPLDHATYSAKRKAPSARKSTNHKDSASTNKSSDTKSPAGSKKPMRSTPVSTPPLSTVVLTSLPTPSLTPTTELESLSPAPSSDKLYDSSHPSDSEDAPAALIAADHCSTVRRSSRRMEGHAKKGQCALNCCKTSPERTPKTKKPVALKPTAQQHQHQLQQQIQHHLQINSDANSIAVLATPGGKVKKNVGKSQLANQQTQQQKQAIVKKR